MLNQAAKQIYDAIKTPASQLSGELSANAMTGTVIAVNPIKIQIENRPPLDEDYLILSIFCIERIITYNTDWYPSGNTYDENKPLNGKDPDAGDHNHTMKLKFWRGLQVGDTVNLIQMSGNQQYFVIDRVGMENDTADQRY